MTSLRFFHIVLFTKWEVLVPGETIHDDVQRDFSYRSYFTNICRRPPRFSLRVCYGRWRQLLMLPVCCVSVQMERQILMQNQMRERQMAMQIAWSREFLKYFGTFFAVASVGLAAG